MQEKLEKRWCLTMPKKYLHRLLTTASTDQTEAKDSKLLKTFGHETSVSVSFFRGGCLGKAKTSILAVKYWGFIQVRLNHTLSNSKKGSLASPVIQANERLSFENVLRSGGLLYCVSQWACWQNGLWGVNVYWALRGVCRFFLHYLWNRAVRITEKPYTPQRERLCML